MFFQYYEMSYGLNIEMHKQVGNFSFSLECKIDLTHTVVGVRGLQMVIKISVSLQHQCYKVITRKSKLLSVCGSFKFNNRNT